MKIYYNMCYRVQHPITMEVVVPPRPGCSFKLVDGKCYVFLVGAASHVQLGQLVCSVQGVLLNGQLPGEDLFLLFESLKLEVQSGELILVKPRRI